MKKILIMITTTILFTGCGSDDPNGEKVKVCATDDASTNSRWSIMETGDRLVVDAGTKLLWQYSTIYRYVCVNGAMGSATIY